MFPFGRKVPEDVVTELMGTILHGDIGKLSDVVSGQRLMPLHARPDDIDVVYCHI